MCMCTHLPLESAGAESYLSTNAARFYHILSATTATGEYEKVAQGKSKHGYIPNSVTEEIVVMCIISNDAVMQIDILAIVKPASLSLFCAKLTH